MAITIQVDGPALVRTGTGGANALEDLGFTVNGVTITQQIYRTDVYSDENGGDQGPPIDIQYFGEMHRIRMEMVRFDVTIMNKIRAILKGGTAGIEGTAGTLFAASSSFYRLLITPTSRPRNYLAAIPVSEWTLNKGTQKQIQVIEWEAYALGSSTLYNAVTA